MSNAKNIPIYSYRPRWKQKVFVLTTFSSLLLVHATASLFVFVVIALFLYMGISVEVIERVMVWVSIPWFIFLYLISKKICGKKIVISYPPFLP